jgi:hypothetical protein
VSATHARIGEAPPASAGAQGRHGRGRLGVLRSTSLLLLALILALAATAVPQTPSKAPETRREETVAPGVERVEIRRGEFSVGLGPDRWVINVLVLDPSRTRLALGRANDRVVGTDDDSIAAAGALRRRTAATSGRRTLQGDRPGSSTQSWRRPYRKGPGGVSTEDADSWRGRRRDQVEIIASSLRRRVTSQPAPPRRRAHPFPPDSVTTQPVRRGGGDRRIA